MTDWTQLEKDLETSTAGPWRLGTWGDDVFGTGPEGEWLSVCRVKRDNLPIEESRDSIDARLISRAPDLAALALAGKRLADALSFRNPVTGEISPELIADALTAFRKAEGESR